MTSKSSENTKITKKTKEIKGKKHTVKMMEVSKDGTTSRSVCGDGKLRAKSSQVETPLEEPSIAGSSLRL